MARFVSRFPLPPSSVGTERHLAVHTYGDPDARPKVYLQGGIHAGELPGPLALHHLIRKLDAMEDRIRGHVMIVPIANPIGQSQYLRGAMSGRYSLNEGRNFNRLFPDIAAEVADAVTGRLGGDATKNVAAIRGAIEDALATRAAEPMAEIDYLQLTLMRLACDADVVLDLHCDEEAVMHLYLDRRFWPTHKALARFLESPVTILSEVSAQFSFDEAVSAPWLHLAETVGADTPVPLACLTSTVEYRGANDVSDAIAEADADRLLAYLQHVGAVDGDPQVPDIAVTACPVAGMERLRAPVPGIIEHLAEPGDIVEAGDVIAELIDPTADDPEEGRVPLVAESSGVLFARRIHRFANTGTTVAKVIGATPLDGGRDRHLHD